MKRTLFCVFVSLSSLTSIAWSEDAWKAQAPTWSRDDLDFFLHGSMSTEIVPETTLRAFIRIYPDLFPSADLSNFGLIPDPAFGWPIGFSRRPVKHLGGVWIESPPGKTASLPSVAINCASCHVNGVTAEGKTVRVLGVTSHFDAEAFFGSLITTTFRTTDPANMKRFLAARLAEADSAGGEQAWASFEAQWEEQAEELREIISGKSAAKRNYYDQLYYLRGTNSDLVIPSGKEKLPSLVRATLVLFHNMRVALHISHEPPTSAPPASGPVRNDAFGLLSAMLLNAPARMPR